MPYGNNALSKVIRRNKRKHFIDVAMESKKVVDYLTFDLSSYFRVQFVVMFGLKGVPFNLREFCIGAYYLQLIGELCYTKRLYNLCPHIKRTTIDNMKKYDLIIDTGAQKVASGQRAKTFTLHPDIYATIDKLMKDANHAIRDTNSKRRRKEKGEENTPESTTEIETLTSFLDSSEFDFLE